MMKKISLLVSFLICAIFSFAQTHPFPNTVNTSNDSSYNNIKGGVHASQGLINTYYVDTLTANESPIAHYKGAQITVGNTFYYRDSTATKWIASGSEGGGIFAGGVITSLPALGDNPGINISSNDFIISEFYQSQPPTSSISGGVTLEYRSAQTMNYTLNWTAGRQAATDSLASIVVAGISQSFSQPAPSNSISGTQPVSFPANTDISYSNVVTTIDSKSATSTTTFSFLPMRYFGFINLSDTAGIGTFGYDDSKITVLGQELSNSKIKTWNSGSPTGTQIYVYAYYYTAGTLNNLILNGFNSLDAFNEVQRNFTNALGFTGQWIIYWNKNGQTLSSDIIAN